MIWNYLVTALRNFQRHKLYSFINIAGLAVGLCCAIFIILYLRDELSYNKWVPDSENVYQVHTTFHMPGKTPDFVSAVPFVATVAMQAQLPGVVAQTHLISENMTAQVGDRQFEAKISVVDPNFFQVIKLPLAAGDPARVLAQPDSVILSQTTARKYFGAADPVGKTITVSGSHVLKVAGILRDVPHNAQMANLPDLFIPNTSKADTMNQDAKESWISVWGWAYVKLAPGADPRRVEAQTKTVADKSIDVKQHLNVNLRGSDVVQLHLTRVRSEHLDAFGPSEKGGWTTIYGFAAIAGLILLIACFNFMNLATARSMVRAREISLRKAMGARRGQLIVQFLGESVLTALVALVLALALVEMLLPAYDSFLDRPIAFNLLTDWPLTLAAAGIAIAAGLFGGVYPALVLSGFRPAATLGTSASGLDGSGVLRTSLVVLQFAISIGLGIATIVVFAQIRYAQAMDIGFDRHNLVVISGAGALTPSVRDALKQTLVAEPSIGGVAASRIVPFDGFGLTSQAVLPDGVQQFTVRNVNIAPDYLRVYGIRLLAGRNLSTTRGEDIFPEPDAKHNPNANILISAAAARLFGFTPETAVGKIIFYGRQMARCSDVGVVGVSFFVGLLSLLLSMVFFFYPKGLGPLSVRIKPGRTQEALAAIDRIWRRLVPTVTIHRQFQDAGFA